jgi:hypothetical protein
MKIHDTIFTIKFNPNALKVLFKQIIWLFNHFYRKIAYKFMTIRTNAKNIVYYIFIQLNVQYDDSMILTLYKS